jgi:hypothetical protein
LRQGCHREQFVFKGYELLLEMNTWHGRNLLKLIVHEADPAAHENEQK